MAVTIDSTQIEYGTAGEACVVRFAEPFAATPTIVSSAGVSRPSATGFEIGGAGKADHLPDQQPFAAQQPGHRGRMLAMQLHAAEAGLIPQPEDLSDGL